jgi:hypothetical protein
MWYLVHIECKHSNGAVEVTHAHMHDSHPHVTTLHPSSFKGIPRSMPAFFLSSHVMSCHVTQAPIFHFSNAIIRPDCLPKTGVLSKNERMNDCISFKVNGTGAVSLGTYTITWKRYVGFFSGHTLYSHFSIQVYSLFAHTTLAILLHRPNTNDEFKYSIPLPSVTAQTPPLIAKVTVMP